MLARALASSLEHTTLQDLSHVREFDADLTIDAMQHIPPEDWPLVLANLHRAARPGGLVYLTVHELERHHIQRAFESRSARGLPAVRGCPGRNRAVDWFGQQGLAVVDEGFRREYGWGYHHFLLRASLGSPAS